MILRRDSVKPSLERRSIIKTKLSRTKGKGKRLTNTLTLSAHWVDSLTQIMPYFARWQRSSVVEQRTHKPLVVGPNPTAATAVIKVGKEYLRAYTKKNR